MRWYEYEQLRQSVLSLPAVHAGAWRNIFWCVGAGWWKASTRASPPHYCPVIDAAGASDVPQAAARDIKLMLVMLLHNGPHLRTRVVDSRHHAGQRAN